MEFLTERGKIIFDSIIGNCKKYGINDADNFEIAMLANSFDLYAKNAAICNKKGTTQKPKEGGWDQVRPEYTVMKNEYNNILKHSGKFGMNPADRERIFSKLKEAPKARGFNLN